MSRRRTGPWLAHRLDADTSGCLAIALKKAALLEMQALFAAGQAEKTYWAIVNGRPLEPSGCIAIPLAKRSDRAGWRMAPDPSGQSAITEWRILGEDGGRAWLELRPRTGRTHQIRVHCAALGWPILGDAVYGAGGVEPLHLHAVRLVLPLTPPVHATAPPPAHMRAALTACGWAESISAAAACAP